MYLLTAHERYRRKFIIPRVSSVYGLSFRLVTLYSKALLRSVA